MRRDKMLKLKVHKRPGNAYPAEEKTAVLAQARQSRSPAMCPDLILALNAGMRDGEIRGLQ